MKRHHLYFGLCLALLLSACGKAKDEEKMAPGVTDVAPDRGSVDLGAPGHGKPAKAANGTPRGYDPEKWARLPEATKKLIEQEDELTRKRKANPNMSNEEYLKAASGGEKPKEYKF